MLNFFLILFGKLFSKLSQLLNLGNGSTWPGHIALTFNKKFIADILQSSNTHVIVIAGTNGKTTTAKLIRTALEANGQSVLQNQSGANLLNGIASTILLNTNALGRLEKDFAIFEIDENNLPLLLKQITPDYLVLLNLFRDQLDRYGEINSIAGKWQQAISVIAKKNPSWHSRQVPQSPKDTQNQKGLLRSFVARNDGEKTTLILNADDPQIAYLGMKINNKKFSSLFEGENQGEGSQVEKSEILTCYFGLNQTKNHETSPDHAADSTYCPNCGEKLIYTAITYSHLGNWHCTHCKLTRPTLNLSDFLFFPLIGQYNQYNTLAAALTLQQIGLDKKSIVAAFKDFHPAFGRQEKIIYKNKKIQLFLSKNPTSFNQSFATIQQLARHPQSSRHSSPPAGGEEFHRTLDSKTKSLDSCLRGNDIYNANILFILNDRIPDGRDVSWIWDTDLDGLENFKRIFIAGDRVYDMGLRIKYKLGKYSPRSHVSGKRSRLTGERIQNRNNDPGQARNKISLNGIEHVKTFENLKTAIDTAVEETPANETLFILPTYSAMLDARKILTGKRIL